MTRKRKGHRPLPVDGTLHLEDVMPNYQRPDEVPWLLPPAPDATPFDELRFDDEALDLARRLGVELSSRTAGCRGYAIGCRCARCAERSAVTSAIRLDLLDRGVPADRVDDLAAEEAVLRVEFDTSTRRTA